MPTRRRHSARRRLTLLYAGLFLLLGTVVLGVTYALASRSGTISLGSTSVAVRATPGRGGGVTITPVTPGVQNVVGAQHNADINRLLAVSWLVLLITAVAAALVGWFVAGRFLRPLRKMTDKARTITTGNLGQRLAVAGPDNEFKQLGDTFDELLARLEASFEAQRRFVANAAHELRTPLTLERTLLQVALADPDVTATTLRATCEELLASGRDQEQLLEALLTLASTERGLERRDTVDLAAAAHNAVAASHDEAEQRAVRVQTALAPATIAGDPALVERLIANLVDNAVRYNDERAQVEVATGTEAGRPFVSVVNSGPRVAPSEVNRLFEPFHRLGRDRTGTGDSHHGLGLSIVRAIALAHDAEVEVEGLHDGGLAVNVSFPAPAPDVSRSPE